MLYEFAVNCLVKVLVLTTIGYASLLLVNLPNRHLDRLQRILNAAAKLVICALATNATAIASTKATYLLKPGVLTFRFLNGFASVYLASLIKRSILTRALRSSSSSRLGLPDRKTSHGACVLSFAAPAQISKMAIANFQFNTLDSAT